jgi:hypothetical protein
MWWNDFVPRSYLVSQQIQIYCPEHGAIYSSASTKDCFCCVILVINFSALYFPPQKM